MEKTGELPESIVYPVGGALIEYRGIDWNYKGEYLVVAATLWMIFF